MRQTSEQIFRIGVVDPEGRGLSFEVDRLKSLPGGHSGREPPDPFPNSEVKTLCADDSVAASHARVGHCQAFDLKKPLVLEEAPGAFFLSLPARDMNLKSADGTNFACGHRGNRWS
jgi:hypothetical protein